MTWFVTGARGSLAAACPPEAVKQRAAHIVNIDKLTYAESGLT